MSGGEAMDAEFDTVARWTARAATDLGPDHHLPAGCRGSGSPPALDWLLDALELTAGESLVDSGAGVGGPAAYAAQERGVHPVLAEPEGGACWAARTLFGHPTVQAVGSALPFAGDSCDAAWSLGVLCTVPDPVQHRILTELRRVVRPPGRIGLLVYVARTDDTAGWPDGNNFPDRARLERLVAGAGLRIAAWRNAADTAEPSPQWTAREDAVTDLLSRRHGGQRAWRLAAEQGESIGRLLAEQAVTGELLSLRAR